MQRLHVRCIVQFRINRLSNTTTDFHGRQCLSLVQFLSKGQWKKKVSSLHPVVSRGPSQSGIPENQMAELYCRVMF